MVYTTVVIIFGIAKIVASLLEGESCDINYKTAWVVHLSRGLWGKGTWKW